MGGVVAIGEAQAPTIRRQRTINVKWRLLIRLFSESREKRSRLAAFFETGNGRNKMNTYQAGQALLTLDKPGHIITPISPGVNNRQSNQNRSNTVQVPFRCLVSMNSSLEAKSRVLTLCSLSRNGFLSRLLGIGK